VYCCQAGLSRCSCLCSSLTFSGLPLRPSTTLAASPGSNCVPAKITSEATNRATTAPSVRLSTKLKTGEASRRLATGAATVELTALAGHPRVEEAVVAEHARGARLEPLHLLGEPVDPVGVRPVEVAAAVVLGLLDLVPVRLRLGLVGLGDRLLER